ncbi:MAG: enoyl-CoA hydratase-related protein [Gemmatimonadaceae bacterium]
MTDAFILERQGAVLTIRFNRPDRLNAFRRAEYTGFHQLLGEVELDDEVAVVVLTGAGRGFCAGEDLKELDATPADAPARTGATILQDITRRIALGRHVYVAAVNGVAAGFGAELACACDIRVAATEARFLFPEVRRGLFVTNGISFILPQLVGGSWARQLLLTGEPIDADTAQRIGLVTQVVEGAALERVAGELAARIAGLAPTAVRLTKRILLGNEQPLERALETELDYLDACIASGEHLEGARAFVEKRPPNFRRTSHE